MKIVVTGGAGFLGSHLVQHLVQKDHEVYSIDNFLTGQEEHTIFCDNFTKADISDPVLLTLSSEQGPVKVFDSSGKLLSNLRPGGPPSNVKGIPLQVGSVTASSGILIKRDPGVPIVYASFAITLIGGVLSILNTKKLNQLVLVIYDFAILFATVLSESLRLNPTSIQFRKNHQL